MFVITSPILSDFPADDNPHTPASAVGTGECLADMNTCEVFGKAVVVETKTEVAILPASAPHAPFEDVTRRPIGTENLTAPVAEPREVLKCNIESDLSVSTLSALLGPSECQFATQKWEACE